MKTNIKAWVFDAYGTLFDVHSVIAAAEAMFPGTGRSLSQLWRQKQLEYTWLRSLMGRYADFSEVTRSALAYACEAMDLAITPGQSHELMSTYNHLALFPDARDALIALASSRLAILSNGAPAMLGPLIQHAGLEQTFAAVMSVDELKIFKPDPRVYALATRRLGLQADEIGFVSSNYWDAAGASNFGFTVFWINRNNVTADLVGVRPDFVVRKLTEVASPMAS